MSIPSIVLCPLQLIGGALRQIGKEGEHPFHRSLSIATPHELNSLHKPSDDACSENHGQVYTASREGCITRPSIPLPKAFGDALRKML